MTADWVAAIASVATFVVIGVTAIAALVQLRQMRNSNQIAVFTELRQKMEAADFQNALDFIRHDVPEKLDDPQFRVRILDRTSSEGRLITEIGNFLDSGVAPLVKHGMVDRDLACDMFYSPVVLFWDTVAPFTASARAMLGYRMWEDLEYLALLCKDFRARFPHGTYPRRARALPLPDPWPEAKRIPD